ncbi:MAG: hypothetical protein WC395_00015 [Bacteroidales bacterium]|jgi:hypothetical protein
MKEGLIFLRENLAWLQHVLIEYKLLYFDLWSIVHFLTGGLLFAILSALNCKQHWKWLFIIITGFEILEATVFIGILKLFMPEKLPDVFIDILLGMAGGYWVFLMFGKNNTGMQTKKHVVMLVTAGVIAFFWTGFYPYQLNIYPDNTGPISITTFLFWWVTGYLLVLIFHKIQTRLNNRLYSILTISLLFYLLLIPFNYLISEVFNIREISHQHNLVIGSFISLNSSLVKFYLFLPLVLASAYSCFLYLTRKTFVHNNRSCQKE